MIFAEQEFLDKDTLEGLRKKSEHLYKVSKEDNHVILFEDKVEINPSRGIYEDSRNVQLCNRFRFWPNTNNVYDEVIEFFGPEVKTTLDQMIAYFHSKGYPKIQIGNVWFQYGDENTLMYRHSDGTIHDATFPNCFTSQLFVHEEWPAEQGGAFRIEELEGDCIHTFNSDPNLWLIWNRDHPHWMEPITSAPILRTIFGVSWFQGSTRVNDLPGASARHQNILIKNWSDPELKEKESYNTEVYPKNE